MFSSPKQKEKIPSSRALYFERQEQIRGNPEFIESNLKSLA
jgi:hypothetical protein